MASDKSKSTGQLAIWPGVPAGGWKRVLLKLSGEVFAGEGKLGVDPDVVSDIARQIADVVKNKTEVAIVIGGGNYFRGAQLSGYRDERERLGDGGGAGQQEYEEGAEHWHDSGTPGVVAALVDSRGRRHAPSTRETGSSHFLVARHRAQSAAGARRASRGSPGRVAKHRGSP